MLAAFSRAFRKETYVLCHCVSASPACSCITGQLQQYTQFYVPPPQKKTLCLVTLSYNWNVEVERTVIQCSVHKVTASRLQCGMWLFSMRIASSSVVWHSLWSASFLFHSIYIHGLWHNPLVLVLVLQWKLASNVPKTLAQFPWTTHYWNMTLSIMSLIRIVYWMVPKRKKIIIYWIWGACTSVGTEVFTRFLNWQFRAQVGSHFSVAFSI